MIKVETLQVISLTSQSSLPRMTFLSMFLTQKSTLNVYMRKANKHTKILGGRLETEKEAYSKERLV